MSKKIIAVTGATGAQAAVSSAPSVPPEVYRTFGFPGADDLGNMFQYKRDFESDDCAGRDLALSRALNPEPQTFAQWLAKNKSKMPIG